MNFTNWQGTLRFWPGFAIGSAAHTSFPPGAPFSTGHEPRLWLFVASIDFRHSAQVGGPLLATTEGAACSDSSKFLFVSSVSGSSRSGQWRRYAQRWQQRECLTIFNVRVRNCKGTCWRAWTTLTTALSRTTMLIRSMFGPTELQGLRNISIFRASFNMLSANEMRGMVFLSSPQRNSSCPPTSAH